jgi:hypothetical protein
MTKKDALFGLIIFTCSWAFMWIATCLYFLLNSVNYNAPTTLGLLILMAIIGIACTCLSIAGANEIDNMKGEWK